MNNQLFFLAGLFLGSAIGIFFVALITSNKIQEAFTEGFERGKSVSVNSIK